VLLALPIATAAAQDSGDSGGDFSGGFGVENGSGDGTGDGFGSFGSFGDSGSAAAALEWGGRLRFDARAIADYDRPEDSATTGDAQAQLELSYTADNSEAHVRLEATDGFLADGSAPGGATGATATGATAAMDEFLRTFVDEAYLQLYYDRFNLQAGYLKTVWGQGDQVHVVDFLNSNDYSDFINPDYIERRLASGMVKLNVPWNSAAGRSGQVELAVLPVLRPDFLPEQGTWAPAQAAMLQQLLTGYAGALTDLREAQLDAALSPVDGAALEPESALWAQATAAGALTTADTRTLNYAQAAARATARLGGVDLGAVYYWGYRKTPSPRIRLADPDAFAAFLASPGSASPAPDPEGEVRLEYDPLQGFGLEGATVIGPFNVRAEAAYYLTEDIAGDDPEVPNNSLEYLLGFDVDLGISSLNLNVQGTGSYILNSDAIDEAGPVANVSSALKTAAQSDATLAAVLDASPYAVLYLDPNARLNYQYDPDGIYTSHVVSAALTDSWNNDRVRPEVSVAMGIERQDVRVEPSVEFVLRDDARFEVSSVVFAGDEAGVFGQYDANDYVQLRFQYSF
tara:strand:+ start:1848 stop:3560 length:1713 start_codon:yes stop_codon:yes gene_type:complete